MFKKIAKFFKSVYVEMKFIAWPTKDDLKEGTTVVIVMSGLVGIFLAVTDGIFSFIVRKLLLGG